MTEQAGFWGWDSASNIWRKVLVDTEGKVKTVAVIDKLNDVGDVNVPTPTDDDLLYWDAAAGEWKDIAHLGVADAHHAQAHSLASHSTKAHSELSDAPENAHHTKFTTTEHSAIGNGAPHHTKYTNSEAQTTVKANVKLNELQVPDSAVALGGKILDNIGAPSDAGDALRKGTELTITEMPDNMRYLTITFIIDGGGSAITTGEKGHLEIPFNCTINVVTMLANQSGSIVVDIWKRVYADFPPTNTQSITSGTVPTISGAVKSKDGALSGWTTGIVAGNILAFNVDSVTDIQRLTISLKVTKT